MTIRLGAVMALGALHIAAASGAAAVEIVGTEAEVAWAVASGAVAGYYVVVARDGRPSQVEAVSLDAKEVIAGSVGQTLVVQVAAFGADGLAGPLSANSDPIRFVTGSGSGTGSGGSSGGGTGTGTGGGSPPPGEEPPPDDAPRVRADFDGDGAADLVTRQGDTARLWLMQGARVAKQMPLPAVPPGAELVGIGDYDGNRSSDLLWEDPETGVLTLWRMDRGAVTATAALDRASLPAQESWLVGGSGDFDGDGRDDVLFFSRKRGEVEVWKFDASGGVAARTRSSGHRGAWSVSAVTDSDGDGLAEVVWLDELTRAIEVQIPGAAPLALGTLEPTWRILAALDGDGDGAAELLLNEVKTRALQLWYLDSQGVTLARDLRAAPGTFAAGADFDANGREDVAWRTTATGAVTLWLGSGNSAVVAGASLPQDAEILAGNGSDPADFRARFCSGDLDRNGQLTSGDYRVLISCLQKSRTSGCDAADLDSDGAVTQADAQIFLLRYAGESCQDQ